jgi:hypothetical protein
MCGILPELQSILDFKKGATFWQQLSSCFLCISTPWFLFIKMEDSEILCRICHEQNPLNDLIAPCQVLLFSFILLFTLFKLTFIHLFFASLYFCDSTLNFSFFGFLLRFLV